MPIIHHSAVIVPPNRQRQLFKEGDIEELAIDMCQSWGQLKAIILREDQLTLIAGERRLRAAAVAETKGWRIGVWKDGVYIRLEPGFIWYRSLGMLLPDELEEAELSENTKRSDLTWQEIASARARLIALRRKQEPGIPDAAIAKELAVDKTTVPSSTRMVTNSVLLAENMHRPEVAKAKSAAEAMKNLSRTMEHEFRAELAKRQEGISLDSRHTLIRGSCLEHLLLLPASTIDCIIADPPYGINADTAFGDMAELDHEYVDTPEVAEEIYTAIAFQGWRVTKEQAHAYIFLDMDWWSFVESAFTDAGWWVWPRPLVWDKMGGMLPHPHHGPRNTYELILYANKGRRQTNGVYADIIRVANVRERLHAAQKPVALYADLLARTMAPGEVVLDPCCGSGTIFPAASRAGCKAIGIEASEKHYATALARISDNGDEAGGNKPVATTIQPKSIEDI